MAPNLLLLAYNPEIAGVAAETVTRTSRLRRLYDFIVETQSRRAARDVEHYLLGRKALTRRETF